MTFASSDLNDGAAVVFFKLTLSNWDRFYAAVGTGGNAPEEVRVCSSPLTIKPW
ncbi:MAG: hypothetical protein SXV54_09565 [Chloroflexota bacterium]|nr:hypothetical protein [Chloroflexota bacterium]